MLDAVIDISHHNGTALNFSAAAGAGIAGVIQKATQGLTFRDPTYAANHAAILGAGLLFGSFHFGTGDDPLAQADFYLQTVGPQPGELLALDLETNTTPGQATMTPAQARAFVTRVQAQVGKWPALYGGDYLRSQVGQGDPVLANCPLWFADYRAAPQFPPGWASFSLWQHTDGMHGPAPVAVTGVGHCDREQFNGDATGLAAFWASVAA